MIRKSQNHHTSASIRASSLHFQWAMNAIDLCRSIKRLELSMLFEDNFKLLNVLSIWRQNMRRAITLAYYDYNH